MAFIATGAYLTPALLARMSVRGFSTLTNWTNLIGHFLSGWQPTPLFLFGALIFHAPGVGGASASALKA